MLAAIFNGMIARGGNIYFPRRSSPPRQDFSVGGGEHDRHGPGGLRPSDAFRWRKYEPGNEKEASDGEDNRRHQQSHVPAIGGRH